MSSLTIPSLGEAAKNKELSRKDSIEEQLNESVEQYDFMISELVDKKDWIAQLKERPTKAYDGYRDDHEELEEAYSQLINKIEELKTENKDFKDKIKSLPEEKIGGELNVYAKRMERYAKVVKRMSSSVNNIKSKIEIKTGEPLEW